jgi:Putative peptidoglycan binding domain
VSEAVVEGSVARRRRLWIGAGASLAAAAVIAIGWGVVRGDRVPRAPADGPSATGRATVERRSLAASETVDGTLGFDGRKAVIARVRGTVTGLPPEGSTLRRGDTVVEIAGRPAGVLLYGAVPSWRTLQEGVAPGDDVETLERNLVALGLDPEGAIRVDDTFDFATRVAVGRLQERLGLARTGALPASYVVVAPGPRRVGAHAVEIGDRLAPGKAVLETTDVRPSASIALDPDLQASAHVGKEVQVELPDGSITRGRFTRVGRVATTSESGVTTVAAAVSVEPRRGAPLLDSASVAITFETRSIENALVVPVVALLATAGGGYAVEVAAGDGTTRLVAVRPGLFARGDVAVVAPGLRAGMKVVVPA